MSAFKLIALILVVAVAATFVQPARAEALEAMTIITIVSAAVLVVAVVAVLVIANVRDRQRGEAALPDEDVSVVAASPGVSEPARIALDAVGVQGQ